MQDKEQPFLVRDVAALLSTNVPTINRIQKSLGFSPKSTNMAIHPDEALIIAEVYRKELKPVAWLRKSDLEELLTCQYMLIGADSPNIWTPIDISTPTEDMELVPVYTMSKQND